MPQKRFNPTVVRLKVSISRTARHRFTRFQSHCGAIKSGREQGPGGDGGGRFNPTVVRLKVTEVLKGLVRPDGFQSHCGAIKSIPHGGPDAPQEEVSIPLWCD